MEQNPIKITKNVITDSFINLSTYNIETSKIMVKSINVTVIIVVNVESVRKNDQYVSNTLSFNHIAKL